LLIFATALLNNGFDQVRGIIGDEEESGLSDAAIKNALWHYYFDIEKTVQWLLGTSAMAFYPFVRANTFPR
jgi:hypothetical protein